MIYFNEKYFLLTFFKFLVSYVRSSDRSGVFGKAFGVSAHARTAEMEH